jgi:hypothetical protein
MNLSQMEFDVTVSIDTDGGLSVEKPIKLASPDPDIGSVSLSGDGLLECSFKVIANDKTEALDKSNLFAMSVADLLAYFYRSAVLLQSARA